MKYTKTKTIQTTEEVEVGEHNKFDYLKTCVFSHPRMKDGLPYEPTYEVLLALLKLSEHGSKTTDLLNDFGLRIVVNE